MRLWYDWNTMQLQTRSQLLSASLHLSPVSAGVNRPTVEAAVWQTLGWNADSGRVTRLLDVIDAYAHTCALRATSTWVRNGRGDELPPQGLAPAQLAAVRRSLELIRASVPVTRVASPPATVPASQPAPLTPEEPKPLLIDSPDVLSFLDDMERRLAKRADAGEVNHKAPEPVTSLDGTLPKVDNSGEQDVPDGANAISADGQPLYRCSSCKTLKPRDHFYANAKRANNVSYKCKLCNRALNRSYRKASAAKAGAA